MARIRTIKPEFWSSPSMSGASPWVRLLYIAMWNWADDCGRGTANVRELAAFAFPHEDDDLAPTAAELPSLLAEVRGRFGVIFYEVRGRRYYAIPSWNDHQRNERRAGSRYPSPDEGVEYSPDPSDQGKQAEERKVAEVPPQADGSSARAHGSSGPGTGEQGNRGTGEEKTSADKPAKIDDRFDEFYSIYPRKVKKEDARKAWRQVMARRVDPETVIKAARGHAEHWDRHGQDQTFIPYPASWLRAAGYNDDPTVTSGGPPARPGYQSITTPQGRILDF